MMDAPKEKVYYNVGTTLYMSPQALVENKYSEKSDIWSLGVMLYQMLCGNRFIKIIRLDAMVGRNWKGICKNHHLDTSSISSAYIVVYWC